MNQEQKSILDFFLQNHKFTYHTILPNKHPDLYDEIQKMHGKTFAERLYRFYHQVNPICKNCGLNPPGFKEFTTGFKDYCSNKCAQRSAEITQKRKDSTMKKYGVEYTAQAKTTKEKIKATFIERYGVTSPAKNPSIVEKMKATSLERYGVENVKHLEYFCEKARQTHLERHGVSYPHQLPHVMDKAMRSRFKLKKYVFPSGKESMVQGCEPLALDELIGMYDEDDIIIDRSVIPAIWYKLDEKEHRYYPDIYIPSQNLIIEVKSTYTATLDIDKIEAKKQACLDLGYNFQQWTYDRKGMRV